jgi:hypothetical protein
MNKTSKESVICDIQTLLQSKEDSVITAKKDLATANKTIEHYKARINSLEIKLKKQVERSEILSNANSAKGVDDTLECCVQVVKGNVFGYTSTKQVEAGYNRTTHICFRESVIRYETTGVNAKDCMESELLLHLHATIEYVLQNERMRTVRRGKDITSAMDASAAEYF